MAPTIPWPHARSTREGYRKTTCVTMGAARSRFGWPKRMAALLGVDSTRGVAAWIVAAAAATALAKRNNDTEKNEKIPNFLDAPKDK